MLLYAKYVVAKIVDVFALPFVFVAAFILRTVRNIGVQHLPLIRNTLLFIGVFPVTKHYYEPQFEFCGYSRRLKLPGIDLNDGGVAFLDKLTFAEDLKAVDYNYENRDFKSGDAEFWYQIVRYFKPKRVIEIGSGYSTVMAVAAGVGEHICIEPFENPWLEDLPVKVIRDRVENIDLNIFRQLESGDILFIDSSHMIRPGGDVLYEYLSILPVLISGVIVHIHDIFTPNDYPPKWLQEDVKFWNEQYLLEAILSHSDRWEVLAALNHLKHTHYDRLKRVCPYLTSDREPGSLYLRRR